MTFAINNATIIDPLSEHHLKKMSVLIENGKVKDVSKNAFSADKSIDGNDLYLSKGWTDLRVHLKEPGFEHKETLDQLLESAKRGGFTSVLTLPNTEPIVAHKNVVKSIQANAKGSGVEVLVSAILSKNGEGEELAELLDLHNAGAIAFTDGDKDIKNTELLGLALLYTQKFDGLIMVHSEDSEITQNGQMNESEMSTVLGLKGIPNLAESSRVKRNLDLIAHYGGRLHFSHISTKESLDMIKEAKKKGLRVTCDISINHLVLDESMLFDYDSNFKHCPPLKSKADQNKFWKALKDGTIDAIVSDHNAQDEESKNLEFDLAECGVIGLETLFPLLVKYADSRLDLTEIIGLLTTGPDKVLGLKSGKIEKGEKADFTVFSTNNKWTFEREIGSGLPFNSPFIEEEFDSRIIASINGTHVFINS